MSKNRNEYMKSYRDKKKSQTTEASKMLNELTKSYRANRNLIEEAMAALNPGTKVYLDHISALDKLDRNHREELVERGLTPGNLGAATKSRLAVHSYYQQSRRSQMRRSKKRPRIAGKLIHRSRRRPRRTRPLDRPT
jgi:hypothetical protein